GHEQLATPDLARIDAHTVDRCFGAPSLAPHDASDLGGREAHGLSLTIGRWAHLAARASSSCSAADPRSTRCRARPRCTCCRLRTATDTTSCRSASPGKDVGWNPPTQCPRSAPVLPRFRLPTTATAR